MPHHKAQRGKNNLEGKSIPSNEVLADFSSLVHLKVLGLMDVTTTVAPNIPDNDEDRRIWTSLSEANNATSGIADTLSGNLNTFDLVHPRLIYQPANWYVSVQITSTTLMGSMTTGFALFPKYCR